MIRVMEQVPTQTLLGIRFWDRAGAQPVGAGLQVTAQPLSADLTQRVGRPVRGFATRSAIYAFRGLAPGERATAGVTLWEQEPPTRFYVVDVADPAERYLPIAFTVRAPLRGPFRGEGDWLPRPLMLPAPLPGQAEGVELWPQAARGIPAGMTALHAQLVVGLDRRPPPAAHALVRVMDADGNLHAVGLAGRDGQVFVPLAYPRLPDPPANESFPPLRDQRFALQVTVHYRPAAQTALPGSSTPDLAALLGQPAAQVVETYTPEPQPGDPPPVVVERLAVSLPFGEPVVLRTGLSGRPRGEPFLRVIEA